MRKILCFVLVFLMSCLLVMPAMAASEGPEITLQPQSPNYPEYSVAIYTVKADGSNLMATWYMEWLGKTYTLSNIGGAMQDWEGYAGEAYGARKLDDNTFAFIFEGIESDLDGAYIWCVIEDGHYDVASQKARISVGNPNMPPEILSIPAQLTAEQGAEAEIRCTAKSPDGSQLSFLWYETDTGRLEDIRAVNRGEETGDYMFCDTSTPGTRRYICMVQTSSGGITYSSFVPVTVTEKKTVAAAPQIQTDSLPDATVGQEYKVRLSCSDSAAQFALYYNPGGDNDFDKSGLILQSDGTISGTPTAVGSYGFCICAAGAGGEDYMVYTLKVNAPPVEQTAAPTETPQTIANPSATPIAPESTVPIAPESAVPTVPESAVPTVPATGEPQTSAQGEGGIPWWVLVLIGVAAAGIGVGVAVILIKKK